MIVYLVLQPGIAFGIRAGLTFQNDGASVGEEEAVVKGGDKMCQMAA
jgi:hypothetical protein